MYDLHVALAPHMDRCLHHSCFLCQGPWSIVIRLFVKALFLSTQNNDSTVSPHHPNKGPIHKAPANQSTNPTRAPDLFWIWPPPLRQIHNRGGSLQTCPQAICESARFWDDEVGPLLNDASCRRNMLTSPCVPTSLLQSA